MCDEIGRVEIGAVKQIKNFRTELNPHSFVNVRFFQSREVPRGEPWANIRVPSDISKKAAVIRRCDKGIRIEPLVRISENHRPREHRIQKRANRIAGVSIIRWVVT